MKTDIAKKANVDIMYINYGSKGGGSALQASLLVL